MLLVHAYAWYIGFLPLTRFGDAWGLLPVHFFHIFFGGFWLFACCCRVLRIWHALRLPGHDATNGEHPGLLDVAPLSTVSVSKCRASFFVLVACAQSTAMQ